LVGANPTDAMTPPWQVPTLVGTKPTGAMTPLW